MAADDLGERLRLECVYEVAALAEGAAARPVRLCVCVCVRWFVRVRVRVCVRAYVEGVCRIRS